MSGRLDHADFVRTAKGLFGMSDTSFDDALVRANAWIAENKVSVLNVETIQVVTGATGITSTYERGVRIWFWVQEPASQ